MLYEILSQQRSGSTYLYRVLKKYLNAKSLNFDNEPFGHCDKPGFDPEKIISEIKRSADHIVVIKNHALHLNKLLNLYPVEFNEFYHLPKKRIVLIRHNQFEKTVSSILAKHYEIWQEQPEDIEPIYVEPWRFRWTYQEIIEEYNMLKAEIKPTDTVVEYEKLSFWPRKDFYNLALTDQKFDELPKFKETKKNKPKDKTIVNLAELEHIYKTEFV